MNIFPESFRVLIVNKMTWEPIKNIAVMITIFATRKNNYHFIPAISDDIGSIHFSQEWLNSEIEKEMNLFIMDYSSRLSDCLPKIEIKVMSHQDIKKAIYAMRLYRDYFKYTLQDIASLAEASNTKYNPISKIVDLTGGKILDIMLDLEEAKDNDLIEN